MNKIVRITSDHIELEGTFQSPARPLGIVVIANANGMGRRNARARFLATELGHAGFATLLPDLLTEDDGFEGDLRFDMALLETRLGDAVRWAYHQPYLAGLPIGLFGKGVGAAAALELAAEFGDEIAAVVSRGGMTDLAAPEEIARIVAPTLFIIGGQDRREMDLNAAAWEMLRCPKSLEIVRGAGPRFAEPGSIEAVAALASNWFTRHMTRELQAA